jgi:hypothetical protein
MMYAIKTVSAAALVAAVAFPAFAQTVQSTVRNGAWQANAQAYTPERFRASPPEPFVGQTRSRNDVYVNGVRVGSDPDANVRSMLERDLEDRF